MLEDDLSKSPKRGKSSTLSKSPVSEQKALFIIFFMWTKVKMLKLPAYEKTSSRVYLHLENCKRFYPRAQRQTWNMKSTVEPRTSHAQGFPTLKITAQDVRGIPV